MDKPRYWRKLTREQMEALLKIYKRRTDWPFRSYLAFRRTAKNIAHMGCVMVPYAGMWLGIEKDGYTHS
jgi:hypothetical protein